MKNLTIKFIFPLSFFIVHSAIAQKKESKVVLWLSPENVEVKLDDSVFNAGRTSLLNVSEGVHQLKLTAPYRIPVDTMIYSKADSTSYYRFILKYKKSFLEYHRTLQSYKVRKFCVTYLPPVFIASSLYSVYALKKMSNNYYEEASDNISKYKNTVPSNQSGFDDMEKDFNTNYKKYKLFNHLSYGAAVVACGITYFYIRALIKNSRKPVPVYNEGLSFNLYPNVMTSTDNKQLTLEIKYSF